MAHSFVRYVGDGVTNTFPVPFPFLFPDNLHVYVDDVEVEYVLQHVGELKVILDQPPAVGAVVTVRRITPRDRLVDFQNASLLDQESLDLDGNQVVYLAQEALDHTEDNMKRDEGDQWDAEGRRIKNVGAPIDPTDVATKEFAEQTVVVAEQFAQEAEDSAQEAAGFAAAAEGFAQEAEGFAEEAETSKAFSEAARAKAELWAEEDEYIEVSPGRYSAKHWAHVAESRVAAHANLTNAHGATASLAPNRIVLRDSSGRASFANPTLSFHAATKGWVEQMMEDSSGPWIGPGDTIRLEALATRTGSEMSLVKRFRIGANGATRVTLQARVTASSSRYVEIQVGERLISSLHTNNSWISYTTDEEVYYIVDPPGRILEVRVHAWGEENDEDGTPHIVHSDVEVRNVRVRWDEIPSPPTLVSEVLSD